MEKFMGLLQRLNERVSNLEINYINQVNAIYRKVDLSFSAENNTFINNNNKWVK